MNKKSVIYFCLFSMAVSIIAAVGTINKIKSERLRLEEEAADRQHQMDIALFRVCDHEVAKCAYEIDGHTCYMCIKCFAYSRNTKLGPFYGQKYAHKLYFFPDADGTYPIKFNHNPEKHCFGW